MSSSKVARKLKFGTGRVVGQGSQVSGGGHQGPVDRRVCVLCVVIIPSPHGVGGSWGCVCVCCCRMRAWNLDPGSRFAFSNQQIKNQIQFNSIQLIRFSYPLSVSEEICSESPILCVNLEQQFCFAHK